MTTITIDRAVLEQALEALTNEHSLSAAAMQQRMDAIITLRAALAQEQAEPVQEPVAWQCREHGDDEWFDCSKESYGINPRRYTYRALYTAPPKAEPVQKPVAWMFTDADNQRVKFLEWQKETRGYSGAWIKTPLYTAPPRRELVPLTYEEILAAVGWKRAEMYMKLAPNFPVDEAKKETLKNARAIEKASWEKNHGQA